MQQAARISAAIEILALLNDALTEEESQFTPSDVLMKRYFRDRRYMGSKDRREVSRLVYGVIRHGGGLEWRLEQARMPAKPRQIRPAERSQIQNFGPFCHQYAYPYG